MLILIGLVAAVVLTYVLKNNVTVSIHSCDVFFPMKFASLWGGSDSLLRYARTEGVGRFVGHMGAFVRSELLDMPPFPSMREGLKGKRLLMIGGAKTPLAHRRARQLGVSLTLVDDASMVSHARSVGVSSFVAIPQFGQVAVADAAGVLAKIRNHMEVSKEVYDGVFTLVEDHGPLTSLISEALSLPGSPAATAATCRSKFMVREAMRKAKLPVPKYAKISGKGDIAQAAATVGFPAFIKPVYGVQATFAARVEDMQELEETYALFQAQIDSQHHPIYHHGTDMILESLMTGSELQLEMALLDGEVVFHSLSSEYSPERDAISFPAQLSPEAEEGVVELAADTLSAIGLTHGVVHLELFYDPKLGAQVVEVNNRLSRGFLPQSFWHQLLFGRASIDYYGAVFALSVGQAPPFHKHQSASPVHMTMLLDMPATDWWVTDPKDAPNRGWERTGVCGLFLAPAPHWAMGAARAYQKMRREDPEGAVAATSKENWEMAKLGGVGGVFLLATALRLLFGVLA